MQRYYRKLFDCQQVNQSLAKVPIEYVTLKNLKGSQDPYQQVYETYFSIPLFQLLNDEMINFDSPDLPVDDLPFLCARYSNEPALLDDVNSPQEEKETWHEHLLALRERNE